MLGDDAHVGPPSALAASRRQGLMPPVRPAPAPHRPVIDRADRWLNNSHPPHPVRYWWTAGPQALWVRIICWKLSLRPLSTCAEGCDRWTDGREGPQGPAFFGTIPHLTRARRNGCVFVCRGGCCNPAHVSSLPPYYSVISPLAVCWRTAVPPREPSVLTDTHRPRKTNTHRTAFDFQTAKIPTSREGKHARAPVAIWPLWFGSKFTPPSPSSWYSITTRLRQCMKSQFEALMVYSVERIWPVCQ